MEKQNFFNITTEATCYINEVKVVKPKKGDAFCALKCCLLEGEASEPEKIYADLIVRGEQAKEVLRSLRSQWPKGYNSNSAKWFASIRFGSINIKTFERKNGSPGVVLSGRLISFIYLKIDKTVIDLAAIEDAA